MNAQPGFRVRWRSRLGVAVGFFLAWGVFNAFLAIFVPVSLHSGGAAAVGGLVMSPDMDAMLLGRSLTDIAQNDPHLSSYLVTFMDTMCAQMMSFAILLVGVTWFALRRGQPWALWVAALASIASFAYFVPIIVEFSRMGVAIDLSAYLFFIPVAVILAVAAVGWFGLRTARARGSESLTKAEPPA
jgi:hypothetical protein